jgi:hypothetical protein
MHSELSAHRPCQRAMPRLFLGCSPPRTLFSPPGTANRGRPRAHTMATGIGQHAASLPSCTLAARSPMASPAAQLARIHYTLASSPRPPQRMPTSKRMSWKRAGPPLPHPEHWVPAPCELYPWTATCWGTRGPCRAYALHVFRTTQRPVSVYPASCVRADAVRVPCERV